MSYNKGARKYTMLIITARIQLFGPPRPILLIHKINNAARIERSRSNKMMHALYQL